MQFEVQVTEATPFESVMANALERAHEAPVPGVENSTRTLAAGRPLVSITVARMMLPLDAAEIVAFGGASTAPYRTARMRRLPSMKKRFPSASMAGAPPVRCADR